MTGIFEHCWKETIIFINEDDYDDNFLVSRQWNEENGFLKRVEINYFVIDGSNGQNNKLSFYQLYCFIKATPSNCFGKVKNNIRNADVIVQVKFAELKMQGLQMKLSAHLTRSQINIFIWFAWLKDNAICSFLVNKQLTLAW